MAMRTTQQFRQLGDSQLFAIDLNANFYRSRDTLASNGMRFATYHEALSCKTELIEHLKGKEFYVSGSVGGIDGVMAFDRHGDLLVPSGFEGYEWKVCVYSGQYPLIIDVEKDNQAREQDFRFHLDGANPLSYVSSAVVGIKLDERLVERVGRLMRDGRMMDAKAMLEEFGV